MVNAPRSLLIPEGPIGADRDILFREKEEFWGRLSSLADHAVSAILSPYPLPATVFGISAPWGGGKSSALHVMLDLIFQRLQEHQADLQRDQSGFRLGETYLLTSSTFRANLHQASGQQARLALAYEVLRGFPRRYWEELLEDLGYKDKRPGEAAPIEAEIFLRRILSEYAESGPIIEEWILRSFSSYRQEEQQQFPCSHVHIELIDDLDRCSQSYTADVLTALNFWSALENVFFVVAADEEHLQESARAATELEERYKGEALEKFVHVQLRLPQLIGSYNEAASYLVQLLPASPLPNGVEHLRKLLADAGSGGPLGLLSPSLRARTPRQAKRLLNELVQEFRILLDFEGDSVKRIVARLAWPQAFEEYIFPALLGAGAMPSEDGGGLSPKTDWLRLVLRNAAKALDSQPSDPSAATNQFVEMLRARGIDIHDCPVELLLYLAAKPSLDLPDGEGQRMEADLAWNTAPANWSPGQSSATPAPGGLDPTESVTSLSTAIQVARELERWDEMRELGQRLVALAEAGALKAEYAPDLGNAAIRVALVDLDTAWRLHQLATKADPSHLNVRLNIADFLLDNAGSPAFETVREHLDWVKESSPEFKAPWQRLLRARLAVASGEEPPDLEDLAADSADAELRPSDFWERLTVLRAARRWDLAEEVGRNWAKKAAEAEEEANVAAALRVTGDTLAAAPSEDSDAEARGADILRHLLCTGFVPGDEELRGTVLNLAITLQYRGYTASAGALYRIAYDLDPRNAGVKGAYSRYLIGQLDDPRNAYNVQQGQEVTISLRVGDDLREVCAELPKHLSTSGDCWWETYHPEAPYVRPPYCPLDALCPISS